MAFRILSCSAVSMPILSSASLVPQSGHIGVWLSALESAGLPVYLFPHSKIEEIFGDKLDWYSSREGSEAKRIIYKREADVFNPSKQEEYFAWMIDKCDELSNALVQVGEMDEEPQEKDKFSKLKQYLENCGKTELTLTFADIEAVIGCALCKSAYNYSAYWTPSPTHTMPNTILAAGFKLVSVDLLSHSLLLRKQ